MKNGKIVGIVLVILSISLISYFSLGSEIKEDINKDQDQDQKVEKLIEWDSEGIFKILVDPNDIVMTPEGKQIPLKATFGLRDELTDVYNEIGFLNEKDKPVFIIPLFTASAYQGNGFYDFYKGKCDESCLTVKLVTNDKLDYNSSANAVKILQLLGYDSITDIQLHNDPTILEKYSKVIVLHNEYVSKTVFDAITSHNNVIFLYPNSLYAEIKVDETNNSITLIRGHGYPETNIENGFDWENENTDPYEFDNKCNDWNFYQISNGHMLNCYPEQIIWKNKQFLKLLKET